MQYQTRHDPRRGPARDLGGRSVGTVTRRNDGTHGIDGGRVHGTVGLDDPRAIDSPAADLRTTLDLKLGEHIILAVKATGAALRGDTDAVRGLRRAAQHQRHGHRRHDRLASTARSRRTPSTPSGAPTTASSWTTPRVSPPSDKAMRTRPSRT